MDFPFKEEELSFNHFLFDDVFFPIQEDHKHTKRSAKEISESKLPQSQEESDLSVLKIISVHPSFQKRCWVNRSKKKQILRLFRREPRFIYPL